MLNEAQWYEQPTDEATRICLRLEHLFARFRHHCQDASPNGSRNALVSLSHILNAVDRNDLKNKLQQLCHQQQTRLMSLKQSPQVDPGKLTELLTHIEQNIAYLKVNSARIGETLRQNYFINLVRQQISSPNGLCEFSTPQFRLWIRQPTANRQSCLLKWGEIFAPLKSTVDCILQLLRHNTSPKTVTAVNGLYQEAMDPKIPCQLVRVKLNSEHHIYPTISVGKHQANIQLHSIKELEQGYSEKYYDDQTMTICYCRA